MDKYKNKCRNASARAQWWNYGNDAAYFITICTQDRINYFGQIENQKMKLTALGISAETCWYDIPNHFPFVKLGAFVVMPNHIHGIVIIDKQNFQNERLMGSQNGPFVGTQNFASLQIEKNKFGPQSQNLASIVRGYKIGVTKQSKILYPGFKWQPRYHDHIIRNDGEYQRINDYIENNPLNWGKDKFSNRK